MHPQTEDYWGNVNTIGPRGCYDESKRFAEAITMAYHRQHAGDAHRAHLQHLRPADASGRARGAGVRRQALRNEPITVFGEGQTRSFCTADLIEGIYRLMMSDYPLPVNIGNPREMTVLDFAKEIIKATSRRAKSSTNCCRWTIRSNTSRHHFGAEALEVGAEGGTGGRAGADD